MAQQVRIDRMRGMAATGVGLLVQRFDAHLLHQRGDMLAADLMVFPLEHAAQHAAAGKWVFQVQLVNPAHQRQIACDGNGRMASMLPRLNPTFA